VEYQHLAKAGIPEKAKYTPDRAEWYRHRAKKNIITWDVMQNIFDFFQQLLSLRRVVFRVKFTQIQLSEMQKSGGPNNHINEEQNQ